MPELTGRANAHRPLLRISQVQSACSFCKGRKIKCDGVAPACGGCTKFGRQSSCSLSTATAQARDYPSHLQKKIQRLQRQIEQINQPSSESSNAAGITDSHVLQQSPELHARAGDQRTIDGFIADIGALPILASSYSSSEGGLTLSNVLLGAATNTKRSRVASEGDYHVATSDLPRKEDALELAEHYFKHVYPRLPFFSTRGFWAQFELAFGSNFVLNASAPHQADGSGGRHGEETPALDLGYSCFTVLLVAAISLSTKPRSSDSLRSYQAQRFFNTALRYSESAIVPNTIIGVQSLLFLIQFAMVHPSILDAWYLIGVGMRCCIDLGLHQDPQSISSISPSLLETRRRLWWSMYSLDRSMSLGCGRPTEISDSVIGAGLPSFRIESSATEAQIQGYLQRYRALQLQSQIYDKLGRPPKDTGSDEAQGVVSNLSAQLSAWNEANDPSYSQTLVESEWLMGKMLLYRPCHLHPERAVDEIQQLWETSLRFAALYRQLVEENSIYYVQVASEKIYWTGLAILHSAWRLCCPSTDGSDRPNEATLSETRVRLWKGVQDVLFILGKLSTKWEDGELLARKFETTSGAIIELVHGRDTPKQSDLPSDVVDFYNYSSLTSLWSSSEPEGQ